MSPPGRPKGEYRSAQHEGTPVVTRQDIARLIPHAGTMCLLDRLVAWSDTDIVCEADGHREPAHPLRSRLGLLSTCLIEYAAQAMALHGALCQAGAGRDVERGAQPQPGFLASARGVTLSAWRIDELPGPLRISAQRLSGAGPQVLYGFQAHDALGGRLAEGRAAVVLRTPVWVGVRGAEA
jgi:predicted hotdog family 3-hydroxylacyl-ACP dehydratase